MTRDEHIHVINTHKEDQLKVHRKSMALYAEHIRPLEDRRSGAEEYYSVCNYTGHPDEALEHKFEIEELTSIIKSKEIEVGICDLADEYDRMQEVLMSMKENAKTELSEYEYYTSSIPTIEERNSYFSKFGIICSTIFGISQVSTVNNLNKRFDQDKHIPVLEGISPFMPVNSILNGMDIVHYVFEMSTKCTIAYNKEKTTWYLLMDGDIVFESDNLKDIFEYRNIVG